MTGYALRVIALRVFYIFMKVSLRQDIFDLDAELPPLEKPENLPKPLEQEAVNKLLSMPSLLTKRGRRDALCLELLYGSGIRVAELCGIQIRDLALDSVAPHSRIHGKGGRLRIVPLSGPSVQLIKAALVAPGGPSGNDFLLHSFTGKAMLPRYVQSMIKKYAAMAGLDLVAVTPHKLRHSFATHMYENGADLSLIQELLGHSDQASSKIYIRLNAKRTVESYRKFHPRGEQTRDLPAS